MDDKVYIDTGMNLHEAYLDKDECLINISREYARVFMYADYLSSSTPSNSRVTSDGSFRVTSNGDYRIYT